MSVPPSTDRSGSVLTSAIADAVATTVATITVTNALHSAVVRLRLVGALGAGGAIGAGEAVAGIGYDVAIVRRAGAVMVAGISAAYGSCSALAAGAATITLTAALAAVAGAATVDNTVAIQATITKGSGGSDNHTCLTVSVILDAAAFGISVA